MTKIHPEILEYMDSQMDFDRDWFTQHPYATKYYRKPFENEIAESLQLYGKVPRKIQILKVTDDIRVRNHVF